MNSIPIQKSRSGIDPHFEVFGFKEDLSTPFPRRDRGTLLMGQKNAVEAAHLAGLKVGLECDAFAPIERDIAEFFFDLGGQFAAILKNSDPAVAQKGSLISVLKFAFDNPADREGMRIIHQNGDLTFEGFFLAAAESEEGPRFEPGEDFQAMIHASQGIFLHRFNGAARKDIVKFRGQQIVECESQVVLGIRQETLLPGGGGHFFGEEIFIFQLAMLLLDSHLGTVATRRPGIDIVSIPGQPRSLFY